jgi:hypothetical protein
MKRRAFVKNTIMSSTGLLLTKNLMSATTGPVYGQNGMTYQLNTNWGTLNAAKTPVNDCHRRRHRRW